MDENAAEQPVVISFSYKFSLSQSDRATVAMATNSSLSHSLKSRAAEVTFDNCYGDDSSPFHRE